MKKLLLATIIIILTIFSIYYSFNFKLDASSDTLILQNDEDYKYYNKYNKIFPSKNFLVLAIKSADKIDQKYINTIKKIKKELIKINSIDSIFSILEVPILIESNLKLSDLNKNIIPNLKTTNISLDLILDEFSKSPLFSDQILSSSKQVSAIIIYPKVDYKFLELKNKKDVLFNENQNNQININEIKNEYRSAKKEFNKKRHLLIKEIRFKLNELKIPYEYYLGGIDMIADDTISYVKKDIVTFGIFVSVFLVIVLFIIFKNIKWVLMPLISTFYSILTMVGLIGFFNWEITAISSNFISLMLILSISMNIHIINRYKLNYETIEKNNLILTLKNMFFPCLYTSLTTIVAFGSLLFSDIKPVIDFGKIMILSLLIIFITSFTILPMLISFLPKNDNNFNLNWKINNLFLNLSLKNSLKIITINAFIFFISYWGITNLTVENSFINYFKKDTEIHKGMKLIDQELGGTTPLDVVIKFKNSSPIENIDDTNDDDIDLEINDDLFTELEIEKNEGWFNYDNLETIKAVHNYLENREELGKVQSIYSLIKVAENINKNNLDAFTLNVIYKEIPELYKELLISPYLSINKNMVKINARVLDSKNISRNQLIIDINKDLSNKFKNVEEIKVSGLLVLYNNMLQSLFDSQIKSFAIVLFVIFLMFMVLFKSIKLSISGIIPNILASSFILGLIGIMNIPLDIMTITVAAITIGIAVDNSIHYLYSVKNNIRENHFSMIESLNNSHNTVGQAVLTTSITIAFGFSVLCLSNFIPTIFFGLFTSIAMIIAMLGVLITLPSILKYINYK